MAEYTAFNWTADWLNAWLAAIGATVLVDGLELAWTDDPLPAARFRLAGDEEVPAAIAAAMPTPDEVDRLAIARHLEGSVEFGRKVTLETYQSRAAVARECGDWTLSATVTDLVDLSRSNAEFGRSPFDAPAPGGETLWKRLRACVAVGGGIEAVDASACGDALRSKMNGLGFDYRRILSPTDPNGDTFVDPVVEVLAFVGTLLVPIRGDGRRSLIRGWSRSPSRPGAFTWPVWHRPRTAGGIDALLDEWWAGVSNRTAFESVPYMPQGTSDTTRGYGSRRLMN